MKNTARAIDGRFDFATMSLVCKCGHELGVHAAENPTRKRPCFNDDIGDGSECDCENFRKVRTR